MYSRRRSVLIGMFLYGLGLSDEGGGATVVRARFCWPRLSGVARDSLVITGALEAWIALGGSRTKPIRQGVPCGGSQMGQIGGVLGVVLGTLLGNINLQMPVILGGSFRRLLLGLVLVRIMPETNFSPCY